MSCGCGVVAASPAAIAFFLVRPARVLYSPVVLGLIYRETLPIRWNITRRT
jgi:hypothetical protein